MPSILIDDQYNEIANVDTTTGAVTPIGNAGVTLYDTAFSPTQQLFGIDYTSLYSIDQTTGAATKIGDFGSDIPGGYVDSLVFGSDGTLYAAGNTTLYRVDPMTGVATAIGDTGVTGFYAAGDLAFNGGSLYETITNGSVSDLEKVDPTTGAGTIIGQVVDDPYLYGLVTASDGLLYGADQNSIYSIDPATGKATLTATVSSTLGAAYGAASPTEAQQITPTPAPTPTPEPTPSPEPTPTTCDCDCGGGGKMKFMHGDHGRPTGADPISLKEIISELKTVIHELKTVIGSSTPYEMPTKSQGVYWSGDGNPMTIMAHSS